MCASNRRAKVALVPDQQFRRNPNVGFRGTDLNPESENSVWERSPSAIRQHQNHAFELVSKQNDEKFVFFYKDRVPLKQNKDIIWISPIKVQSTALISDRVSLYDTVQGINNRQIEYHKDFRRSDKANSESLSGLIDELLSSGKSELDIVKEAKEKFGSISQLEILKELNIVKAKRFDPSKVSASLIEEMKAWESID